jgi:hypothetical protein
VHVHACSQIQSMILEEVLSKPLWRAKIQTTSRKKKTFFFSCFKKLARHCGRAPSDHGVRRGRESFDGQREIAKKKPTDTRPRRDRTTEPCHASLDLIDSASPRAAPLAFLLLFDFLVVVGQGVPGEIHEPVHEDVVLLFLSENVRPNHFLLEGRHGFGDGRRGERRQRRRGRR